VNNPPNPKIDSLAGDVHPKHSDINLAMPRYSHTLRTDESKVLKSLPQFPSMFDSPQSESATLRATGTENTRPDVLQAAYRRRAHFRANPCLSVHRQQAPMTLTTSQLKSPETRGKTGVPGLLFKRRGRESLNDGKFGFPIVATNQF
jgi:hypothetical protein